MRKNIKYVKYNLDFMVNVAMMVIRCRPLWATGQVSGAWRRREELMESREKRWAATTLLAAGLFVIGGMGGAAQDATPTGGSGHAHPAHIHLGTCDALDPNPTFPLTDVALGLDASSDEADGATAIPVER